VSPVFARSSKALPVQAAWVGFEGSRGLRFSGFIDNRHMKVEILTLSIFPVYVVELYICV
jgi:hypothetical protein